MSEATQATAPAGHFAARFLEQTALGDHAFEASEPAPMAIVHKDDAATGHVLSQRLVFGILGVGGSNSNWKVVLPDITWLSPTEILYIHCPVEWPAVGIVSDISAGTAHSATAAQQFEEALLRWRGLVAPHHLEAMQAHVERLLGDEDELREDDISPSMRSFDELLEFLARRRWARPPAVGLDRRGCFSLSWIRARDIRADLTLTFLGDGLVRWYFFDASNPGAPISSAAGTAQRKDLSRILAGFGCEKWGAM